MSKHRGNEVNQPKRAAIYARVSTDSQTTDNQTRELRAVAKRMGWEIVGEFKDHGISGAKGRAKRPEFDRLIKAAARKECDVVMAWSVDRLGRSLKDLLAFLGDLHAKDVDLYLHQQGIDTTTPSGKMMFQMLGVFAEFERELLIGRINSGLARARSQGKRLGRPLGTTPATRRAVIAAHAKGAGKKKLARLHGIGVGTVQRIIAAKGAG